MPSKRPPPWEHYTLDAPDHDPNAVGPVHASDGRTWPDLHAALADLEAEGWRLAGATREAARVRYTLRRPRP